jgi:acyl carrier protein
MMNGVLAAQGRPPVTDETQTTRDLGFRSLDFSELALRVEMTVGRELNFQASELRAIETVADVLDFFDGALAA